MWHDNKQTMKLLNLIMSDEKFPTVCPVCGKETAHMFFYRFKPDESRGGMWLWCSSCHSSSHTLAVVPKWWINLDDICSNRLASLPDYLEENSTLIDEWVNSLQGHKP